MNAISNRKQQLELRLVELDARLGKIDTELDRAHSPVSSEAAHEREDDEMLVDLGTTGKLEIRMIEAALDRIDHGGYGVCVACGDPISEERLDVLPHTPKCRNCAG